MLKHDGIPTREELQVIMPTPERLEKGPVAIIECFQDIPCDPCVGACPVKAIHMESGITAMPHLEEKRCTGCGICITGCPGLAIFVLNMAHSKKMATLSIPYEMLPVPRMGDIVLGLDRTGKAVCEVKVLRVGSYKKHDRTWAVTIELPKELAMDVRGIKVTKGGKK